ncbi:MAG: endonuclease III [Candidatus Cloacimonetes bacterium 4572_65]|nr:MAG: endonuclease III [Candidatus Cloacimonetes bacterium 4572_65]
MTFDQIYKELKRRFEDFPTPVVDFIEAQTQDPFKILVATILSARTKDETTTKVVIELFKVVNVPEDLLKFSEEELQQMIYPVGFYRHKAKYLSKLPTVLKEEFNNVIPEEIDELLKLPGVGRKTANLVRAIAFKKPAVCVDVHVHRIFNRLGFLYTKNPEETEMTLRRELPVKYWIHFNSYFVAFGQNLCTPRKPKCSECPIYEGCDKIGVKVSR